MAGLREAMWTIIKLHDRPLGLSISMRCRRALVVRSVPVFLRASSRRKATAAPSLSPTQQTLRSPPRTPARKALCRPRLFVWRT